MPTKPTHAQYLWATNPTFVDGPAALIGQPTKVDPLGLEADGYHAQENPFAQWENFTKGIVTDWTEWVRLGTNVADADAHLVETDATGDINCHAINAVPIGGTGTPLTATAFATGNGAVVRAAGAFDGLVAFAGTGTSNAGVTGNGGSANGTGVVGFGGGIGVGVHGQANANASAVRGTCLSGGVAIDAVATVASATALGLLATTSEGTAAALVKTDATTNPCLAITHPVSPVRGAINISNTGVAPSSPIAGDISLIHGTNGNGRGRILVEVNDGVDGGGNTGTQTAWTSANGPGHVYVQGGPFANFTATLKVAVTVTLDTTQAQVGKPPGIYYIHWSHSALPEAPFGSTGFNSELQVNGTMVQEDGAPFAGATVEGRGGGTYVLNAAAATVYVLRIMVSRISVDTVSVPDATIAVVGAFDVGF